MPRRWSAPLAVGVAGLGLAFLGLTIVLSAGRALNWAYDLNAYYDAALRFVSSGTPYQVETLAGPFRPGPSGLYLYSPLPALLAVPLTSLSLGNAAVVWFVLRVALLAVTCAVMPVPRNVRLLVFGVAAFSRPVIYDLDLGNVSVVVTFLSVIVWRWLDRPAGALALAVSLTVRPTMALVAAWWVLRLRWRPVAWTVALGVVVVGLTLPFLALQRWFDWGTVLLNVSDVMGIPSNADAGSAVLLVGGRSWLGTLALIAGYVIAVVAVLWSLRRDRELSFVVTLMATLLLSPLLWSHYLTQLLVPAAFLAARGRWWGLLLPLLGWLPDPAVPLLALAGMLAPFLAPDRGPRSTSILDVVASRLGRGRLASNLPSA
jgi:Glycosyltransferase family 87